MRHSTPSVYVGKVAHFAFRRTLTYTDTLSVAVSVLVPAIQLVVKQPAMSDWLPGAAAWFVIILVGGSALLRLLTAPYFVWREQEGEMNRLEAELQRPDEKIRASLDQTIAASRVELMGFATRITPIQTLRGSSVEKVKEMFEHQGVLEHVYHLSYDAEFQKLWEELKSAAYNAIRFAPTEPNYSYSGLVDQESRRRYYLSNLEQHWQRAEKNIHEIKNNLSRHLFMKA